MAENLSDADNGKILCVDNDVASGGAHALPASAKEFKRLSLRRPLPQSVYQSRAIHFARSFAGGDQNLHSCIVTGRDDEGGIQSSAFAVTGGVPDGTS